MRVTLLSSAPFCSAAWPCWPRVCCCCRATAGSASPASTWCILPAPWTAWMSVPTSPTAGSRLAWCARFACPTIANSMMWSCRWCCASITRGSSRPAPAASTSSSVNWSSVVSRIDEVADVLRELAGSLRELPLQEMVTSATQTLQALEKLTSSAELRQGLLNMSQLLGKLDRLSGRLEQQLPPIMDNVQQSSIDLRDAVGEIRRAAQNAAQALQQGNQAPAGARRRLG